MEGSHAQFRIQAKGWFLTYPKCSLTKEEVLEALKEKRSGLKQVLVSRELHEDGSPHLHCYLYYDSKFDCSNQRFFDIAGYHPNVQSAKSLKAVRDYVKKDGDYIQEGMNYKAELEASDDHVSVLCKRLLDGENEEELIRQHPKLVRGYKKLVQDVEFFKLRHSKSLPLCTTEIPNTWGLTLSLSVDKNRHYWLWSSAPNLGKTTFLTSIQSSFPSLWYSVSEKYQVSAPGSQFVLLDEYSVGHLTITQLNSMCDGTYRYPVKSAESYNLPGSILLVCGNKSPLAIYSEEFHALLQARFTIIDLASTSKQPLSSNPLKLKYYDPETQFTPINGPGS